MTPTIHLIAPAGPLHLFYAVLGIERASQLLAIVQEMIAETYVVTGNEALLDTPEDEQSGGRRDDRERAEDITAALSNPSVRAIVAIRGGAWFTRILPRVDFSVLDRRETPIAVFGFSELTSLVNIVAVHPLGRGFYDMGPAFLTYGLKRHAATRLGLSDETDPTPDQWMRSNLRRHMVDYFRRVIEIIEGWGKSIELSARLVRGQLPDSMEASFVGGNLTVLSTMIGSRYMDSIDPGGKWIVLEDFNDKLERMDRFLAHLTLAGFWDRCAGLLLGDFHRGDDDLRPAILAMLDFHSLHESRLPVLTTDQVGHIWPMTPLPLHQSGNVERRDGVDYRIRWSANDM